MKRITDVDIRRAAMDLLARREHGAAELKQKLQKRFDKVARSTSNRASRKDEALLDQQFAETVQQEAGPQLEARIEAAIEQLTREGLQSDRRLAEAFIRSRANRGQGPIKIKAELRQKGIQDGIILDAMAEADQDWYGLAAEVASKKFRDPISEPKDRAKRSRFLQQRGFSFDHIASVEDF